MTLLREIIVASRFGVSDQMDAFVAAFVPISIGANLIASLSGAVVPAYVERQTASGLAHANELVEELMVPMALLVTAITLVAGVAAPGLMAFFALGFPAEKQLAATSLFRMMLPVLPLAGCGAILSGVLNARERYWMVALAPVAIPLTVLGSVVIPGFVVTLETVAVATTVGFVGQACLLVGGLWAAGTVFRPRVVRLSSAARKVVRESVPLIAGNFVLNGTVVVDQVMASILPTGSVSTLSYGGRLSAQIAGLSTVTVGTLLLPRFSRIVAEGRDSELLGQMRRFGRLVLLVGAPATLGLVLSSGLITRLLYLRGELTAADAVAIADIQALLFLQLPFVLLAAVFVRVLLALNQAKVMLVGCVISVFLNAALDLLLVRFMGAEGIALSTAIVAAASCAFLGWNAFAEVNRRVAMRLG